MNELKETLISRAIIHSYRQTGVVCVGRFRRSPHGTGLRRHADIRPAGRELILEKP